MTPHLALSRRALRAVLLIAGLTLGLLGRAQTGSTYVTGMQGSGGVCRDTVGNLYIASGGSTILKVTTRRVSSLFATLPSGAASCTAIDSAGNVYVSSYTTGQVFRCSPAGVVSLVTTVPSPMGLAVDGADNLYIASPSQNTIYKIPAVGLGARFAVNVIRSGEGGEGPYALTCDTWGNLYTAGFASDTVAIKKISPSGHVTTFATGSFANVTALAVDDSGRLLVCKGDAGEIDRITPSGVVSTYFTGLVSPVGMASAPANVLYVSGNNGVTVVVPHSVSVNFSGSPAIVIGPSVTAGIVPAPHWQDLAGNTGTNVALTDSDGAATPMHLTWSAPSLWGGFINIKPNTGTAIDSVYLGGLRNNTSPKLPVTAQIDGIPFAYYHVYVYSYGSATADLFIVSGNSSGIDYRTSSTDMNGTITALTESDPVHLTTGGAQYQVFRNNSASLFSLVFGGGNALSSFIRVFGLQVVESGPPLTPPVPEITSPDTATGSVNQPFSYQITADFGPTSFGASGLPLGLSVDSATGIISGTPTSATGSPVNITLTATNANGTGTKSMTLTLANPEATVALTNLTQTYDGTVKSASATTSPAGLPVAFSYTGAALPPVNAGSYGVIATIDSTSGYTGSATGTLSIVPAAGSIVFSNTSQVYTGRPRTIGVTTTPAGLATTVTYNGSRVLQTLVGNYTVNATISDPNYQGNAATTFSITKANATVTLGNLTQGYDGSAKTVSVTTVPAGLSVGVTYAGSSTAPSNIGSYAVVATVADANYGGSASGTLKITDSIKPVLSLPGTITAEATSAAGATVSFSATANDNVDGNLPVTFTPASGSIFPLGRTTVTATATDAAGNTATGSFDVIVGDTTKPTLTLPAAVTVEAADAQGAAANFAATASDAVTASPTISYSTQPGATFAIGTTTVTVTATDGAGNSATGSFTVTVRDTTAPSITASDLVLEATGPSGAVATFSATAVDSVSGTVVVNSDRASGTIFPIGQTVVGLTATDGAGNIATKSFKVTVQDTTAPTIQTPANLVLEAANANGAPATFSASATDLVDGEVNVTSDIASGTTFPLGTTAVTLTATDAHGNTSHAVFSVTVHDTTAPVVAAQDNLVIEATGPQGAVANFTAIATDLVDGVVAATASPASGSTFALGTTTVTLTATDAAHNTGTGTFTVTVRDTTAPTIVAPADVTAEATSAAGAVVTFSASANDSVDGAVAVTASPASGRTFALGTTTVTLTATDAHGNTSTSNFAVTVRDTTAPHLSIPANQSLEATSASGAVATFLAAATDAVSTPAIAYSQGPGTVFPLGTTVINVTATDDAGNVSHGSFQVMVRDTTAPIIAAVSNLTVEAMSSAGAAVTFHPTASDSVDGNVSVTASPASGSTFALGVTAVALTATDAHGNTSTATFNVTVRDTTAPILQVPANLIVDATSAAGAAANYAASATDAVSSPTLAYSIAPGSSFPIGTTTVNVTAIDLAGNTASGSFTVTVRDVPPPTIVQASASVSTLWPANKKWVPITISATTTGGSGATSVKIVSVATNEPGKDLQWQITGNLTVNLLADRLGSGNGRIYTITIEARNAAGHTARTTVTVSVPHDQGK